MAPRVALRKESVDRNCLDAKAEKTQYVALRKESVDRNGFAWLASRARSVALRKESVDRNSMYVTRLPNAQVSLSARRAWIEIIEEVSKYVVKESLSARRAWIEMESKQIDPSVMQSLSARRAWIEISMGWHEKPFRSVALRKESVDRN